LFGHKYPTEVENVNKTVGNFEAEAKNK
jgi:hypothetical protein